MHCRIASVLPLLAMCLTQGCAAVLVPVAATGLAARHQMKAHQGSKPAPRQAVADAPLPPAGQAASGTLDAVPADPATMQPGKLYRGALPGPSSPGPSSPDPSSDVAAAPGIVPPVPAGPVAGGAATDGPGVRPASDWNDVSRYVAGQFAQSPSTSVLLMPGTTLATPRWVPCGVKPVAVLVDLDAVVPSAGRVPRKAAGVLGAVETLQIVVVYTTRRSDRALAAAVAALATAGLHRPDSGTLFPVAPDRDAAVRGAIGARYCVVAITGDRAEDFPNKATPETAGERWNQGWFLVPSAERDAR